MKAEEESQGKSKELRDLTLIYEKYEDVQRDYERFCKFVALSHLTFSKVGSPSVFTTHMHIHRADFV